MPDFIDPLNDPRFPDRPNTPDFWRLAEGATWVDGKASDTDVFDIVSEFMDWESAFYLAKQRVLALGLPIQPQLLALYMDALTIGARFQDSGGHRAG